VFLTTHYLEEADGLCDRIGIIDHGKIVALDSPATLKRSVGGDVLTIGARSEQDLSTIIAAVPGIISAKRDDGNYRVKAINGEAATPNVLKAIWEQGVTVTSVTLTRPTLDEAFLEYTGRSLRDAEQSGSYDRVAASHAMRRRR
jgi:ABC-2 type transport system ATP-binding protein